MAYIDLKSPLLEKKALEDEAKEKGKAKAQSDMDYQERVKKAEVEKAESEAALSKAKVEETLSKTKNFVTDVATKGIANLKEKWEMIDKDLKEKQKEGMVHPVQKGEPEKPRHAIPQEGDEPSMMRQAIEGGKEFANPVMAGIGSGISKLFKGKPKLSDEQAKNLILGDPNAVPTPTAEQIKMLEEQKKNLNAAPVKKQNPKFKIPKIDSLFSRNANELLKGFKGGLSSGLSKVVNPKNKLPNVGGLKGLYTEIPKSVSGAKLPEFEETPLTKDDTLDNFKPTDPFEGSSIEDDPFKDMKDVKPPDAPMLPEDEALLGDLRATQMETDEQRGYLQQTRKSQMEMQDINQRHSDYIKIHEEEKAKSRQEYIETMKQLAEARRESPSYKDAIRNIPVASRVLALFSATLAGAAGNKNPLAIVDDLIEKSYADEKAKHESRVASIQDEKSLLNQIMKFDQDDHEAKLLYFNELREQVLGQLKFQKEAANSEAQLNATQKLMDEMHNKIEETKGKIVEWKYNKGVQRGDTRFSQELQSQDQILQKNQKKLDYEISKVQERRMSKSDQFKFEVQKMVQRRAERADIRQNNIDKRNAKLEEINLEFKKLEQSRLSSADKREALKALNAQKALQQKAIIEERKLKVQEYNADTSRINSRTNQLKGAGELKLKGAQTQTEKIKALNEAKKLNAPPKEQIETRLFLGGKEFHASTKEAANLLRKEVPKKLDVIKNSRRLLTTLKGKGDPSKMEGHDRNFYETLQSAKNDPAIWSWARDWAGNRKAKWGYQSKYLQFKDSLFSKVTEAVLGNRLKMGGGQLSDAEKQLLYNMAGVTQTTKGEFDVEKLKDGTMRALVSGTLEAVLDKNMKEVARSLETQLSTNSRDRLTPQQVEALITQEVSMGL